MFEVVTLALLVLTGVIEPRVERNMVVHLKQEGVNRLTVANHFAEELLVDLCVEAGILLLYRDLVDFVLSLEFNDLHLPIQSKVSVLATQAPVKELVKVNVTVVATNAHLQHHFLHLVICGFLRKTQWHRQLFEEVIEFLFSELEASVPRLGEVDPD